MSLYARATIERSSEASSICRRHRNKSNVHHEWVDECQKKKPRANTGASVCSLSVLSSTDDMFDALVHFGLGRARQQAAKRAPYGLDLGGGGVCRDFAVVD